MYLCGADVIQIVNSMMSPEIFILCVPRNSWDDQLKEYIKYSPKHKRHRVLVIEDAYEKTISSTKIRELMKKLNSANEEEFLALREKLKELMDEQALDYLLKNELYKLVV